MLSPQQEPSLQEPSWTPFLLSPKGEHADPPRPILTLEGIGDRLRSAAFAEIQAREAFLWATVQFKDAPLPLQKAWLALASEEDKHLHWLLKRMEELKIDIKGRHVCTLLWESFQVCKTAKEFAKYMASAEERGRKAGERFCNDIAKIDPISAELFGKIAKEEVAHIALAARFFPD